MRLGRTLPPAASPITMRRLARGVAGAWRGPAATEQFQREIKDFFGVRHAWLLSSGKAALTTILRALKHRAPDREEVLIPAYTCYSVPAAIVRAGLKVRLADIDPDTLDYDYAALAADPPARERLLAALSIHLFGLPADPDKLAQTLNDPAIAVIEDAAQAMGTMAGGKYLGTAGTAGFFSLGRGKALSTVAGGIIVTDSDALAEVLDPLIDDLPVPAVTETAEIGGYALALSVLTRPSWFWLPRALPVLKLGRTIYDPHFPVRGYAPLQAGLAAGWQAELTTLQQVRTRNVRFWGETVARFSWLQPVWAAGGNAPVYPLIRFPVLVQEKGLRNKVLARSDEQGLGIMPGYPGTIDALAALPEKSCGQAFPGAGACADRLLTLPVHGFVSEADRRRIKGCLELITAA